LIYVTFALSFFDHNYLVMDSIRVRVNHQINCLLSFNTTEKKVKLSMKSFPHIFVMGKKLIFHTHKYFVIHNFKIFHGYNCEKLEY